MTEQGQWSFTVSHVHMPSFEDNKLNQFESHQASPQDRFAHKHCEHRFDPTLRPGAQLRDSDRCKVRVHLGRIGYFRQGTHRSNDSQAPYNSKRYLAFCWKHSSRWS